jgi:hypothetical protein
MWEKLSIRERDRKLARLFVGALLAAGCCCALAAASAVVGAAVGVPVLAILGVAMVRRALALREGGYGPAPVGPLSPDEKAKARSKLVGPCSRGFRY